MGQRRPVPLIVEASFVAAAAAPDQLPPPTTFEIAFAGRSNVGKSSLINSMIDRRNLVRTSSTPGCTRLIAFFAARAEDDARFLLVDLPGYGYAKRAKTERHAWAMLVERYLLARPTLGLVLLLCDLRRGLEPDDELLLEMLRDTSERPRAPAVLVVATKVDRISSSVRQQALDRMRRAAGREVLGFSTHDRETRSALWAAIRREVAIGKG